MYESYRISDASLSQIVSNFQKIIQITSTDIAVILSHDTEVQGFTDVIRERVKSLITICLLADRLRAYASYPSVLDPDKSLKDWFHAPSVLLEDDSPLEFLRNHPQSGIENLRDILMDFFGVAPKLDVKLQ